MEAPRSNRLFGNPVFGLLVLLAASPAWAAHQYPTLGTTLPYTTRERPWSQGGAAMGVPTILKWNRQRTRLPLFPVALPKAAATSPLVQSFASPLGGGLPPDPVIAVGPDEILAMTNGGIALMTKDGEQIDVQPSCTFFYGTCGFDPKILFDPHSQRFFVLMLNGTFAPDSWLQIAVSKSASPGTLRVGPDPSDDWWRFDVDADLDGGQQITYAWADFPGLGVDRDNLYITANMILNHCRNTSTVYNADSDVDPQSLAYSNRDANEHLDGLSLETCQRVLIVNGGTIRRSTAG